MVAYSPGAPRSPKHRGSRGVAALPLSAVHRPSPTVGTPPTFVGAFAEGSCYHRDVMPVGPWGWSPPRVVGQAVEGGGWPTPSAPARRWVRTPRPVRRGGEQPKLTWAKAGRSVPLAACRGLPEVSTPRRLVVSGACGLPEGSTPRWHVASGTCRRACCTPMTIPPALSSPPAPLLFVSPVLCTPLLPCALYPGVLGELAYRFLSSSPSSPRFPPSLHPPSPPPLTRCLPTLSWRAPAP